MLRIMLVDGRDVDAVRSFLEERGTASVHAFTLVEAAEKALARESYDVIVSGHHLPGTNGLDLLRRLRARGDKTPFILFTKDVSIDLSVAALNLGATFIVPKLGGGSEFEELDGRVQAAARRGMEEAERETAIEFLRQANSRTSLEGLIHFAVTFFRKRSGCEALGIRLIDGHDFPYYEAFGFSPDFIRTERYLCSYGEDGEVVRDFTGNPILECMCGNIISGRFDPSKPFFTKKGSFCSNCTTALLASTTERDRQARTRNRCNGEGYESVALIPLTVGDQRIGLLQLNDRRKDMFTAESIALWERLADYLALEISKFLSIEELRRARQSILEREERLREIVENSPDHILVQDIDLRYVWVLNPQLGLSTEEMVGRTDYDLGSKEDADTLTRIKTEVLRTGCKHHALISLPGRNGVEHFDGVYVPRYDAGGRIDGVVGYFRNVTQTMLVQEALKLTSHKLNIMSSITRHDITNQLMVLNGNLELLIIENPSLASRAELRAAEDAAERIGAMVEFTKEYESIGILKPDWQDVTALIVEAARDAELGEVRLECSVPNDVEVLADPLLKKVFHNLMQNSLQHGERVTRISMRLNVEGDCPRIIVEDDGVGIPHGKKDLFTQKRGRDHGLGLFLSHEILSITGIEITEEGEPGAGARFVLKVPRNGFRRMPH
jgi:PAS domain S-box-containing protein